MKSWLYSRHTSSIDHKLSIYAISFSAGKGRSRKHYGKLYAKGDNPDHITMHVSTNNLNSDKNPQRAAESIIWFLRMRMLQFLESHPEMTNGKKAEKVNHHLKDICRIASIGYIDNSSFNPKKHLNNSKFHLNEKGSYKLSSVFLNNVTTLFKLLI